MEQETRNLLKVAQKNQLATDSHHLVEHDPRVTEFPVHSYVLFTPPVGRNDKLVPYQVMSHAGAVYTIQDLVNDKVHTSTTSGPLTTTPSARIPLLWHNRTPKNCLLYTSDAADE